MERQRKWSSRLLGILLLISSLVGCRGANPVYRASALPAALSPPPRNVLHPADLTRLAVAAAPSEILQPGDLVELTIATGLETESPVSYRLRIGEDGQVVVPLVGEVFVAGLTVVDAEQRIRQESIRRGIYVSPNVSLVLVRHRMHHITVAGAVRKPGTYELPASSSSVLAAVAAAEGFAENAGTVIEIHRPVDHSIVTTGRPAAQFASSNSGSPQGTGGQTIYIDITRGPNHASEVWLEDGATVVVRPKEKEFIFVNGLVRKPDRYELPDNRDLHLLDALAMAGGRTLEVADKVHILRRVDAEGQAVVIRASVREATRNSAANLRLAPGDVVIVEETPLTFIVGTIQNFVRFGFTSGIPGL